jgi:hypothetical protein
VEAAPEHATMALETRNRGKVLSASGRRMGISSGR